MSGSTPYIRTKNLRPQFRIPDGTELATFSQDNLDVKSTLQDIANVPPNLAITEVSATYTAKILDDVVVGTGTFTVNLPAVATALKILFIKSVLGTITVDADGAETIDGSLTAVLTTNQSVTLVPTSVGWIIV